MGEQVHSSRRNARERLRLYVHRLAFWRDPCSVFDFTVVSVALVPAAGPFAELSALRVLRLLTMVPSMRRVVGALLAAIPGLGSIATGRVTRARVLPRRPV